jgi:hypothetical protein
MRRMIQRHWWAFLPAALAGIVALIWNLFGAEGEIITYDPGGYIGARAAEIAAQTEPAQIVGYCASACTMYLLTGCVAPGAVLIFHGPEADSPASFEAWSRVMARHYPPAISVWFLETGRYGTWRMTGAEAIRLGARPCP